MCHNNISSENTVAVCTANAALLTVIMKEISLHFFNDKASLCINLVLHDYTSCQSSPTNVKAQTKRIVSKVIYDLLFCVAWLYFCLGAREGSLERNTFIKLLLGKVSSKINPGFQCLLQNII